MTCQYCGLTESRPVLLTLKGGAWECRNAGACGFRMTWHERYPARVPSDAPKINQDAR